MEKLRIGIVGTVLSRLSRFGVTAYCCRIFLRDRGGGAVAKTIEPHFARRFSAFF